MSEETYPGYFEMHVGRMWVVVAVVAAVVATALLLSWQRQEPSAPPNRDAPSTTGNDKATGLLTKGTEPERKGAASAPRRILIVAVDLRGRPIKGITVSPSTLFSKRSASAGLLTWKRGMPDILVSGDGCVPAPVTINTRTPDQLVVTLARDPQLGMRRIEITASLADLRSAPGAVVVARASNGHELVQKTDERGELLIDTGEHADQEWALSIRYEDEHGSVFTASTSISSIPAAWPARLKGEGAQPKIRATLADSIELPRKAFVEFALVSLDSGQALGGGGQSGHRSRKLTCPLPGQYRVVAKYEGRLLAQGDVWAKADGTTSVTLEPVSGVTVECSLSPELAAEFGSLLLCPQSLVRASSRGAMAALDGIAMSGQDILKTVWLKGRITRVDDIDAGIVRASLPESEDGRLYVIGKKGELLARSMVRLANVRGGTVHVRLPQDAAPLGTCTVKLFGDLRPLQGNTDTPLLLSVWDRVAYTRTVPVALDGNRLVLPDLPIGQYQVRFGVKLGDRYIFPVTPYVLDLVSPPAETQVLWPLVWPAARRK